ncbi:WD40 repeat domain-containing protein [Anaerolineae bacterium CFX9]|nr:WD40 repeat domain-containing protein [Anaerolineae bacterium CFX9]
MDRRLIVVIFLWVLCSLYSPTKAQNPLVPNQIAQLGRGTAETLDWHPGGDVLAVGGNLGVWFYDDSLADLGHFPDTGSVAWLAWSPDGRQLATANQDDDTVRLWDVNLASYQLHLKRSWTFHDDSYFLRFSWAPEGERLAVITSDGAEILDVNTGKTLLTIPDLEFTLAWHPDGTQIAGMVDLGGETGEQVRVWDVASGAVVNTYMGADPSLFWSDIQWSPDGSVLVGITSIPATLHAWSVETGDMLNDVDTFAGEFSAYFDMWWLNDGQQLVTVSRHISSSTANSVLDIWDSENWTTIDQGFLLGDVRSIVKRPNADVWALLTGDSQMMTWGLEKAEPLQVRSVHSQPPYLLAWSSDNQHLAAASPAGESITIWDITIRDQPQAQREAIPYQGWNLDELRWGVDGDTLIGFLSIPEITAPGAFPIAFIVEWDSQTGKYLGTLHETPGYVAHDGSGDYLPHYIWSDDFIRVVTEMGDRALTISTAGGESDFFSPDEEITTIDIVDDLSEIIWSPDNTLLAVITHDSQGETSAWVYDAKTGDLVNRLRPSFWATLYDISWSPDSSMVALVGRRGIAGSGETEYGLDVLEVDPSSDEAAHITTLMDIDTTFHHAWHPESRAIAVTTSVGIGIYSLQNTPIGVNPSPIILIPDMQATVVDWSPDSSYLASGHENGTTRIWDMNTLDK